MIQDIFEANSHALGDDKNIKINTTKFLNWLTEVYYAALEKNIGFTAENDKIWPGQDEADILIKNIEVCPYGLTQFRDFDGSIKDKEIKSKLVRRFHYDNGNQRMKKLEH